MRCNIQGAVLAVVLSITGVSAAQAQNAARVYDTGPVWTVGYVETKPGMFDDYMAYLNGPWRAIQEAAKRRGDVLDYKVLAVNQPRDHEADVVLLVEYKNMAVFDRSLAEQDKDTTAVFGSVPQSNQSAIKRENLRVLRGGFSARELRFLK
jgi:hypothetical protein